MYAVYLPVSSLSRANTHPSQFFKHVIPAGSSGRGSAKRVMHLANIRMYDEEVYQEIQEQKREEEGRLKKTQERTRRQRTVSCNVPFPQQPAHQAPYFIVFSEEVTC